MSHEHVVLLGTGWRDLPESSTNLSMVHIDFDFIEATFGPIVFVVEGGARGADRLIQRVAHARDLPRATIPARWKKWGKKAGTVRNEEMRNFVDVVSPHIGTVVGLAYPAPMSVGTRHMMELIRERGWPLHTHEVKGKALV